MSGGRRLRADPARRFGSACVRCFPRQIFWLYAKQLRMDLQGDGCLLPRMAEFSGSSGKVVAWTRWRHELPA